MMLLEEATYSINERTSSATRLDVYLYLAKECTFDSRHSSDLVCYSPCARAADFA